MRTVEKFFKEKLSEILERDLEVTLEILEISSLERSPKYQREIRAGQIDRMLKNFNPFAIGILVVNRRMDRKKPQLIDGNHRAGVLASKGILEWPCLVINGLNEREEATLWDFFNKNRGQPNSSEVLKARIIAKNPIAVKVANAVHAAGMRFRFEDKIKGLKISAASALMNAEENGVLENLIEVLKNAWPGDPHSTRGWIVHGLCHFLRNEEVKKKLNIEHLIKVLKADNNGPKDLISEANRRSSGSAHFCRMVAQGIKERYNKGLVGSAKRIEHDFFKREPARKKQALEVSSSSAPSDEELSS